MPTRQLGRSITAEELADQLDHLVSPHTLRKWARQGRVPGAFKIGRNLYFARNTASWLVRDLSIYGGAGLPIGIAKEGSTVDGLYKPS